MHSYRQNEFGGVGPFGRRFASGLILIGFVAIGLFLATSAAAAQEPSFTLKPPSLTFPEQLIGSWSRSKTQTVTNTGTTDIIFTNVALEGVNVNDFKFTTNCLLNGGVLPPGASCICTIAFHPSLAGGETATLLFQGNFQELGYLIQGSGTAVIVKPKSVSFPSTTVGTTSAPQTVTFKNVGSAALTITSVAWSGQEPIYFNQTNTCGTSVPARSSCTFTITFTPLTAGTFTATLAIGDPDPSGPQKVTVIGTGVE